MFGNVIKKYLEQLTRPQLRLTTSALLEAGVGLSRVMMGKTEVNIGLF